MSMTREEAIKHLQNDCFLSIGGQLCIDEYKKDAFLDAVEMGVEALRPVSREQVERMFPGCKMCSGWNTIKLKPCVNGDLGVQADIGSAGKGDTFGLVVYSHLLASGYVDFPFCPFCGKPKTDEAVQMVMERLEALKDGKGD